MKALLLAVDTFLVQRWLNANVESTADTGAGFLRPLLVRISSTFNDVFGYPHARLPSGGSGEDHLVP